MKSDEKRQLENQLIAMGLGGLRDRNLVPEMARLIPNHEIFRMMLDGCKQEKRVEMYEAIRPHLKFTPKPLETYISELAANAGAIESHHEPIKVGDQTFETCQEEAAQGAVALMLCHKCRADAAFFGFTPVDAVVEARKVGWKRDVVRQVETCPKCCALELN